MDYEPTFEMPARLRQFWRISPAGYVCVLEVIAREYFLVHVGSGESDINVLSPIGHIHYVERMGKEHLALIKGVAENLLDWSLTLSGALLALKKRAEVVNP